MKNIDKIIPISAIFLSFIFGSLAVRWINAEGYNHEEKIEPSILEKYDFNTEELEIIYDNESITLSAFLDLEKISENIEVSKEDILKVYDKIINREVVSSELLRKRYEETKNSDHDKFQILIVPGHDIEFPGAIFRDLTEVQINIELANKLEQYLNNHQNIRAFVVRDENNYHSDLEYLFNNRRSDIQEFIFNHKVATQKMIKNGLYKTNQLIKHNHAEPEVVSRLYGINKWSNEEGYDMAIHIHFNDYPRRNHRIKGQYNGFSIYIPEKQFHHSEASRELAEEIRNIFENYFISSNLPIESDVIIETQDLIAIGSNHTLNYPSILIEYDYLYEDKFQEESLRLHMVNEKAYRTYLGIKRFLNPDFMSDYETKNLTNLIHNLEEDLWMGQRTSKDVISLQAFLQREGYLNINENDRCRITGNFDLCTQNAVKRFQADKNIKPSGFVGRITRELINGII